MRPTVTENQNLSDISQMIGYFDRTVALYDLLFQAGTDRLKTYWEQVQEVESKHLQHQIQSILVQRWAAIAPEEALVLVSGTKNLHVKQHWLDIIYCEWSRVNLNGLLQYADDLDLQATELVLKSIFQEREELSVKARRDIARRFDNEWLAIEMIEDSLEFPEIQWLNFLEIHREELENLSVNQVKVLNQIVHAWLLDAGAAALAKMRETLPSTFSLYDTIRDATHKLLDVNPGFAIDLVFDQIGHATLTEYYVLIEELMQRWAEIDSRTALIRTNRIEMRGLRQKLQYWIVKEWAEQEPWIMLQDIDSLPSHLKSVAHSWAFQEVAINSPEQAFEMLHKISDASMHRNASRALARGWVHHDVDTTFKWINTDDRVEYFREELMESALHSLAETKPNLALQIALQQPLTRGGIGLEHEVIRWVVVCDDLDLAISLLPEVRAGTTRSHAYNAVIADLIKNGGDSHALKLFFELSEIETMHLHIPLETLARHSPAQLFNSLDQISLDQIVDLGTRAEAARVLFANHQDNGRFTQGELTILHEMIQSNPTSQLHHARDRVNDIRRKNR